MIAESLENFDQNQSTDVLYKKVQEVLIDLSLACLGKKPRDKNDWLSTNTLESINLKKEIRKTLGPDSITYHLHCNNIKRLCRIDKEKNTDKQYQLIKKKPASQQYFETIKKLKMDKKQKRKTWTMKANDGSIINERDKVVERWKKFYQGLHFDERNTT